MRPLKLRIAGLRSYRTERTVDFADLSLVAIIGPTGAGKSSLLEAITYALYGASTWDKRGVKELIADAAPAMSVSLQFEADAEVWQVTRMISRKTGASHELLCLSNPEVAKIDGDRPVNARIEELVGLDYDGFCACVLLPQGKFEQLLKATRKERASVLKGILRLDELDRIRDHAIEVGQRLTPRCDEILTARGRFLPDPASTIAQAAAREKELAPRRQALEEAKTTVDRLIEEVTEHRRVAREAEGQASRIEELIEADLLDRLGALDKLERELAAALVDAAAEVRDATEAARAAEQAVNELRERAADSASITTAAGTLSAAQEDSAAIAEEAHTLAEDRLTLTADRERHLGELTRLEDSTATLDPLAGTVEQRRTELEDADHAYQALTEQLQALINLRGTLATARDEEQAAREQQTATVAGHETAIKTLARATEATAAARASLSDEQRNDLAAQLAHACGAGEPCPICARPLPEDFIPPTLPDGLQALEVALATAEQTEQTAIRNAVAAEVSLLDAGRLKQLSRERLDELAQRWTTELGAPVPDGLSPNTVELDEATLSQLKAPRQAAVSRLDDAQRQLAAGQAEHTRLEAICTTTSSEHARRAAALDSAEAGLDQRGARILSRLRQLPAWVGLGDAPDQAALSAAAQLLAARLADAREQEGTAAGTATKLEQVRAAARAIEDRLRAEVADPAHGERAALVNLRSELARGGVAVPGSPTESGIAALTTWAALVVEAGLAELRRLRIHAQAESSLVQVKTSLGKTVVSELGFEDSTGLQRALIAVSAEEISAKRERDQAAAQLEPAGELDALLVRARTLRDGLGELARQLSDAKFIGFVVQRRQIALLTTASGIFARMTAGQFGFTEDFQIIDRRSDMARSPDTLSGGETFLASLALALGLVELAGRSGGRLQALFLDEGFGSLDPEALAYALTELEQRAQAGRLIALISHVPAVAEWIDEILQVTKTPQGSDIRLLSSDERQALLLDDAAEAATAVR